MKILCVSDFVDPLIYNPNVKVIFPDIDLILCAGDLPMDYIDFIVTVFNKPTYFIFGNHNLKEYHFYHKGAQETSSYMGIVEKTFHGSGATYLGFKSIVNHQLKYKNPTTGEQTPLLIAGVSGSLKYNNGLNQFTDFQMKLKLLKLVPKLLKNKRKYGRYLDIFMTHASPRHIHDKEDPCHKGFECFNWFLQKYTPTYMIHGHIHLYDLREERVGKYFETTVINAYSHYVLDFPSKEEESPKQDILHNQNGDLHKQSASQNHSTEYK